MLHLPRNWKRTAYFNVICRLAGQIPTPTDRAAFDRAMLTAALELLAAGLRARTGRKLQITRQARNTWSVGRNAAFTYLPDLADRTVLRAMNSARPSRSTYIIGPSGTHLATSTLSTADTPPNLHFDSLDYYIDLRLLLTSGDLNQPTDALFRRLLRSYHHHLPATFAKTLAIRASDAHL